MKQIRRKLLALLVTAVMLLGLLPKLALALDDPAHSHCVCGAEHSAIGDHADEDTRTWQAWTESDKLPETAGNYYLTKDVTLRAMQEINSDIALCLNGHTISGSSRYRAVNVAANKALILTDCQGGGKLTDGYGVVIYGTLLMYGGSIEGNTTPDNGGGVSLAGSDTVFRMYGGSIANNTANDRVGGGVSVGGGEAYLYGGSITGNTARIGGGVYVGTGYSLYMYGGSISGNKATSADSAGGGVHMCDHSSSHLHVSGKVIIQDNTRGSDDSATASNVYLASTYSLNNWIVFDDALAEGSFIGVTTGKVPTANSALDITGSATADYSKYFSSDNPDYTVAVRGSNVVQLKAPAPSVAQIERGGSAVGSYESLSAALSAAQSGDTVRVIADVTGSGNATIPEGKSITLTADEGVTVAYDVYNNDAGSTIAGGIYTGSVDNSGVITGGVFNGKVTNSQGAVIQGGTFNDTSDSLNNGGTIAGGAFKSQINLVDGGTVTGGSFDTSLEENIYFQNGSIDLSGATLADDFTLKVGNRKTDPATSMTVTIGTDIKLPSGFAAHDSSGRVVTAFSTNQIVTIKKAAPQAHTHAVSVDCSATQGDQVEFTAWSTADAMPTEAGNYVLTTDVALTDAWTVPEGITNLCLNGHVLQHTGYNQRTVLTVGQGATLALCDCDTTTQHKFSADGNDCWVLDEENGDKTVTGGVITGGTGGTGGGVHVDKGTMVMYGGNIVGNQTDVYGNNSYGGGGVYAVGSAANFTLHGGRISGNFTGSTAGGGGLRASSSATLTITGGEISENTVKKGTYARGNPLGGGVSMGGSAVLNLSGGSIVNNTVTGDTAVGGGVTTVDSTFNLSGGPTISGNTPGGAYLSLTWNNVSPITVTGPLTFTTPIGLSVEAGAQLPQLVVKNGKDYLAKFTCDQADCSLAVSGNDLRLITTPPEHTHDWATAWSKNDTHHWHECTADGCNVTENSGKDGYAAHAATGDWQKDETTHWKLCVCGQELSKTEHVYDDDVDTTCNTCGYTRTVTPPPHTHTWATDWSRDDTHHWHACTADGCDITNYAACGETGAAYGVHVYDNDQDATCNTCGYTRTVTPPTPGQGDVTGEVEVKPGTPAVSVDEDALKDLAGQVQDGDTVTVKLTVEKQDSPADKADIEAVVTGDKENVLYLDLSLLKQVNDGEAEAITNAARVLEIAVPYDFTGKKDVTVYRKHGDNDAEKLAKLTARPTRDFADGSFFADSANGVVYIYASKFSTYAIGYTAQTSEPTPAPGYRPGRPVSSKPVSTWPFTDVKATDNCYEAVKYVYEKGWMLGTSDTTFSPEGELTRAMLAAVLYRAAGSPKAEGAPEFADTQAGQWYSDAVAWAAQTQVLRGYGNGNFGPEDPVSREMLDMVMARLKGEDPAWTGDPALALPATRAQIAQALMEQGQK